MSMIGTIGNDTLNDYNTKATKDYTNDRLNGEAGDDYLSSTSGNDTLLGGTGDDTLESYSTSIQSCHDGRRSG